MNLKKTIVSLFAAGTLLVSGGGIALGQNATSTANGTVTVAADGSFNAVFCGHFTFDGATTNSTNPSPVVNSQLRICYTDTQAHRGAFRTTLQASDFTNSSSASIPASNVKPLTMHNVLQGQWGTTLNGGYDIGDIGAITSGTNYGSGNYVNSGSAPWAGGDLSSPQYVGYGWAGVGTGGTRHRNFGSTEAWLDQGSIAPIDLQLKVPSNTPGGTYTSVFTLTVVPGQP